MKKALLVLAGLVLLIALACKFEIPTKYEGEVVTIAYLCIIDGDTLIVFDGQPISLDTIPCAKIDTVRSEVVEVDIPPIP